MSVFSTLYVLLKGDTSDAEKSLDRVDDKTKKVTGSLGNLVKEFTGVIAGFVSVAAAIKGVSSGVSYAIQLDQASRALNVNAQALDVWGNAVQTVGGTTEGFQQSLKSLATHLNIRNQDALRLLPMLADTFKRAGTERSMALGSRLGLDQGTIMLLQKGRRGLDEVIARQKELGIITKKDTEIAQKFNQQWIETTHAFRSMFITTGTTVLPVLTKIVSALSLVAQFFRNHSSFIEGSLVAIGGGALWASRGFLALRASALLAAAPVIALGLAFALVYDDLKTFMDGGDSLIGRMFDRWPKALEAVKVGFETLGNVMRTVGLMFDDILGKQLTPKDIVNINDATSRPLGLSLGIPRVQSPELRAANEVFDVANRSPINTANSSIFNRGDSNRAITINTGPITITTEATDAEGIAGALGRHLTDTFRSTTAQFDNGIAI